MSRVGIDLALKELENLWRLYRVSQCLAFLCDNDCFLELPVFSISRAQSGERDCVRVLGNLTGAFSKEDRFLPITQRRISACAQDPGELVQRQGCVWAKAQRLPQLRHRFSVPFRIEKGGAEFIVRQR